MGGLAINRLEPNAQCDVSCYDALKTGRWRCAGQRLRVTLHMHADGTLCVVKNDATWQRVTLGELYSTERCCQWGVHRIWRERASVLCADV